MFKCMRYIDYISYQPHFYYQSQRRYKTVIGGLFQLLLLILFAILFCIMSFDMFFKTNPKITTSEMLLPDPPSQAFSNDNFTIIAALTDPVTYQNYMDETIYRIEFQQGAITNNDKPRNLITERCDLKTHLKGKEELGNGMDLSKLYCVNPNETFKLQGQPGSADFYYFKLRLFQCRNSTTSKVICKSQEEIDKKLAGCVAGFFFLDRYIDPLNVTNPEQIFLKSPILTISNQLFIVFDIYINTIELITDIGWIISDLSSQTFYNIESITEYVDLRKYDDGLISEALFRFNNRKIKMNREYKKVQNVLAEVMGFFGSVMFVVNVIANYITEKSYFEELFNQGEFNNRKSKGSSFLSKDNNELVSINHMVSTSKIKMNNNDFNINNNKTIVRNSIKRNLEDKGNGYSKFHKEVKKILDPMFLYDMFVELSFLKKVLLDPNQEKAVDSLLSLSRLKNYLFFSRINERDTIKGRIGEIMGNLKGNNNDVSKKLIKLYEELE